VKRIIGVVLAFLFLAAPLRADQLHWLDVIGMPDIPADGMVRHVQVIWSTQAVYPKAAARTFEGWTQHSFRLAADDTKELATALETHDGWSLWRSGSGRTYAFEFFPLPRGYRVRLSGIAWLPDDTFCPYCDGAMVHTRQEAWLTRADVVSLAANLRTWLTGDDMGGLIWSKLAQQRVKP